MKIRFTTIDISYACYELVRGYTKVIPVAINMVQATYGKKNDNRTLVIVLTCPCCRHDYALDTNNAVLVSLLHGIDCKGYEIHQMEKYPPFRNPGKGIETKDAEEFLQCLKVTIDEALKNV